MLTEKTFDTGELTLNYAEGPASGPAMVLLHGLSLWRQSWDALIPELTSSWHVFAFDLRGHGKSGRVANEYHVVDYSRDIVAFLRSSAEPTVLVGHSLGGCVALVAAGEYPEGVRAVVSVDPGLLLFVRNIASAPVFNDWFTWLYETMKDSPPYEAVVARCRKTLPPDASDANVKQFADMVYSVAADAAEAILSDQILEGLDLSGALQKIKCPTLVLQGDWANGGAMRDEDADFVRANLPSAVIVNNPNRGHIMPDEHPGVILHHMNAFLAAL
jgi:pimeloyl-ACP methyl ester carboxylesterase